MANVSLTNMNPLEGFEQHERLFSCKFCLTWFVNVDELLCHVDETHENVKITTNARAALYSKWADVLKMEKNILQLISENKTAKASDMFKSFLQAMLDYKSHLFEANDNIFQNYVLKMQSKLEAKAGEMKNTKNRKRKKKIPKNGSSSKRSKKNDEFSSDDDICLKDTLDAMRRNNSEPELTEYSYYVVPEKRNRKSLTYSELNSVRHVLHGVIVKSEMGEFDKWKDVILRRYDCEPDEVIPDEAILLKEWRYPDREDTSWTTQTVFQFLHKNIPKNIRKKYNKGSNSPESDSVPSPASNLESIDCDEDSS